MIMRRIAGNLRRQDWTAVVVELVVVVAGVFIGLQASNWNTDRETNAKSAAFTQRLRADLRVEAWGYQYLIDYYTDVPVNAERSIDALTGKHPLSDDALRDTAMQVYASPTFDMITEESENSPYRKAFRMALPNDIQRALEHACGDRVVTPGDYQATVHSLDYACSAALPAPSIAASAGRLRADSRLQSFLRLRVADVATDLGNLTLYDDNVGNQL